MTLKPFPVDEFTLNALKHALEGSYTIDDKGNHVLIGADFSLNQFLDFMSDYIAGRDSHFERDIDGVQLYVVDKPTYHITDIVRSLIAEVERLRSED